MTNWLLRTPFLKFSQLQIGIPNRPCRCWPKNGSTAAQVERQTVCRTPGILGEHADVPLLGSVPPGPPSSMVATRPSRKSESPRPVTCPLKFHCRRTAVSMWCSTSRSSRRTRADARRARAWIVADLVGIGIGEAVAGAQVAATNARRIDVHAMRLVAEGLDAEIGRLDGGRIVAVDFRAIEADAERVDRVRAEHARIAEHRRRGPVVQPDAQLVHGRQQVVDDRHSLLVEGHHVAAEERVVGSSLVVDLGDDLALVALGPWPASREPMVAARISRGGSRLARLTAAGLKSAGSIRLFTNGGRSTICRPLLQAGEVKAVKSPASIAAVGT